MLAGGFIYPFSEFATPAAKLSERLGYQADPTAAIKEARQLMTAAGHANGFKGVDWLVRDGATTKLWAMAIQAMLRTRWTSRSRYASCKLRTGSMTRRQEDSTWPVALS